MIDDLETFFTTYSENSAKVFLHKDRFPILLSRTYEKFLEGFYQTREGSSTRTNSASFTPIVTSVLEKSAIFNDEPYKSIIFQSLIIILPF